MNRESFEWSPIRDLENIRKHGVSFGLAQQAFLDSRRLIYLDVSHSILEKRYFCIGAVAHGIITVRFTYRHGKIRIFGAGYWRKGKLLYEKENGILR